MPKGSQVADLLPEGVALDFKRLPTPVAGKQCDQFLDGLDALRWGGFGRTETSPLFRGVCPPSGCPLIATWAADIRAVCHVLAATIWADSQPIRDITFHQPPRFRVSLLSLFTRPRCICRFLPYRQSDRS